MGKVSVRALLKEFNWKHVSIIYDEDEVFYLNAGPSMVTDFEEDPQFPASHPVPFRSTKSWVPENILKEASNYARGKSNKISHFIASCALFENLMTTGRLEI